MSWHSITPRASMTYSIILPNFIKAFKANGNYGTHEQDTLKLIKGGGITTKETKLELSLCMQHIYSSIPVSLPNIIMVSGSSQRTRLCLRTDGRTPA